MRILWVGHNLSYPPVRGVLLRNYNLLREASRQSEVHVVAFDQPASRPAGVSAEDCADALRQFCAKVDWIPLSTGFLKSKKWLGVRGLFSRQAYDLNWMASSAMASRLQQTLATTTFDVVHFDTIGLAQYQHLATGVGTVLNHHNIESSMMEQRAEMEPRRIARWYWRAEAQKLLRAERQYCSKFPVNLVVSPEDGEILEGRTSGVRTQVVANGVDTEYFTPRADPGGTNLLFCGGLDWYPNGDAMKYFFGEIWSMLAASQPDVRITIVGRNPPDWLVQLGAADPRVTVTGFVDDVRPYFREAAIYVCPIRTGGGTRLKILDALAMGMPLVSTTFACSGISLEGEKHVLLADTPRKFADQIVRAIADRPLRERLAKEGRDHISDNYSWKVVGVDLLKAYSAASSSAPEQASSIPSSTPL